QLLVGHGRPQEIAQPRSQLPITHGGGLLARWRVLDVEEERRRDEDTGQDTAEGVLVRIALLPQRLIEAEQILLFAVPQRPAEREGGELAQLLQLRRRRGIELALERLEPLAERLAHPFVEDNEFLRLVLRHEADEQRQVLVLGDRPLRHEAVLGPQPVEALR